ncbi:L-lactate dehydrogenase [Gorillibacterium sp. sgz5001074]|uniref:L-lactate dehydrogenase n=1 Tax=Gorillibacterium sp. sgz5001074 TaxID=3446695 RepID=UPI003F66C910
MGSNIRKVAIVGTGLVGSSCAYAMINQSVCEELMLVNRSPEQALAQALDLSHCMDFTYSRTKVYAGDFDRCGDMDVVILAAGGNPTKLQSRLDVMESSVDMVRDVVPKIMQSGFNGIFVVASNPVDIVTYAVWKLSGLPRSRVVGTGTSIDSSRLKTLLSEVFPVEPKSVQGYVLGEHGESQFVAWSHVTVGGKPIRHIIRQNPGRFGHLDLDDIADRTRLAGWEIYKRKGSTYFGIGNALAFITRSVLNDDHKIIAVSAVLEGEYGEKDVCVGVPAIISRDGVQEVVELNLDESELEKFRSSCAVIRSCLTSAKLVESEPEGLPLPADAVSEDNGLSVRESGDYSI